MRFMTRGFFTGVILVCTFILGLAAQQTGTTAPDYDKLLNIAALNEKAPEQYEARFTTTKGTFVIHVRRNWAPLGADRFYNLVKNGYYDNCRIFRMLPGFAMQFGINGNPLVNTVWSRATIQDDPVKQSNRKGYVAFAKGGPNSRTTQVFISFTDNNVILDGQGFAPFGTLIKGTEIVQQFYYEYLDGPPDGKGPDQNRIHAEGNAYLDKFFPKLDYIKTAVVVEKKK